MKSCLVMPWLSFIGRDMVVEYWWPWVEEAKLKEETNRWCKDQGCTHLVKVNRNKRTEIFWREKRILTCSLNSFSRMKQILRIDYDLGLMKTKWAETWENLNPRQGMINSGRQWKVLSEYQLMWIQCDGECCLEKLASLASTLPVARDHETDWADYAADYVSKKRDKQHW